MPKFLPQSLVSDKAWNRRLILRTCRLPTLAEINVAAPDTPVFLLHLYDRALLNRAALRAVGSTLMRITWPSRSLTATGI
jgi:predicted amidohydrolase YtcJ